MQHLNTLHESWQAQLPENWHESWDWLLTWDTQQLIAVMGYCLARTLNGASERLSHKSNKVGDDLAPVEKSLGFTLRDWWQPTKDNFFGRIGKELILDYLLQAGQSGASRDVLKMKKGDAAELAQDKVAQTRWVPDCLTSVSDITAPQEGDAVTDTQAETDADNVAA